MANDETALAKVEEFDRQLAVASTPEEVKVVRAMGAAYLVFVKQRRMGVKSENDATTMILRAERKIGKMLRSMRESGELVTHRPADEEVSSVTTLPTLGITRDESATWQRAAAYPDDTFEMLMDILRRGEPTERRITPKLVKEYLDRMDADAEDET